MLMNLSIQIPFPLWKKNSLKDIIFPISRYIGKTNDWDVTFGVNKTMHLTNIQLITLPEPSWRIGSISHSNRSIR